MTKALNSIEVLLLVGIVCMVSVIFPRGVAAQVAAQSVALPMELEESMKSCSRIIDQEEHEVIQGFGHFATLPSPPHWQTYANPLATDQCRQFAYVELVGVGGQNILITPETVLVPVANKIRGLVNTPICRTAYSGSTFLSHSKEDYF